VQGLEVVGVLRNDNEALGSRVGEVLRVAPAEKMGIMGRLNVMIVRMVA
jgi:hypothetical protein